MKTKTDELKGIAAHAFWAGSYRGMRRAWMLMAHNDKQMASTYVAIARAANHAYISSLKRTLRLQGVL